MRLYCVALLCLFCNYNHSQTTDFGDIKKLVDLTIDTERIDLVKQITMYDALEIEKASLNKDLDRIKEEFYIELAAIYQGYTQEEIIKMNEFYGSGPGKKLAGDLKLFSADNFPVYEEWIKRVLSNKEVTTSKAIEAEKPNQASVRHLIDLIGVPEYLAVAKEYKAMWQEPQHEAAFRKQFETATPELMTEIEYYFLAKYSLEEIRSLLLFYESPLGKKIKENALKSYQAILDANNRWIENWEQVNHDRTFGKYQKTD